MTVCFKTQITRRLILAGWLCLLLHGVAASSLRAEEIDPDEMRVKPVETELVDLISGALPVPRNQLEIGEVAHASGAVDVARRVAGSASDVSRLQIGDKLYVGDVFTLSKDAQLELVFGINARIRVEGGSSFRLRGMFQTNPDDNGVQKTIRLIELKTGSLRARVKKNEITPSLLMMVAGHAAVLVQRGDAVLSRSGQVSEAYCLRQDAGLVLRESIRDEWGGATIQELPEKSKAVINDQTVILGEDLVNECDAATVTALTKKLWFHIDDAWNVMPVVPESDPEFEAP